MPRRGSREGFLIMVTLLHISELLPGILPQAATDNEVLGQTRVLFYFITQLHIKKGGDDYACKCPRE